MYFDLRSAIGGWTVIFSVSDENFPFITILAAGDKHEMWSTVDWYSSSILYFSLSDLRKSVSYLIRFLGSISDWISQIFEIFYLQLLSEEILGYFWF